MRLAVKFLYDSAAAEVHLSAFFDFELPLFLLNVPVVG